MCEAMLRYWQLDPARASALLDTTHPAEAHENWQAWDETLQVMMATVTAGTTGIFIHAGRCALYTQALTS